MPIYDYRCRDCDEAFEKNVKMAEMNDPQECPHCGAMDTFKFIGGAPGLTDSFSLGRIKPPADFRNRLQEIHKSNPGSQMHTMSRYI